MKTYEYTGFSTDGKGVKGLIEAESSKEVREKLAASGILAEKVSLSERSVKLDTGARASVYRELSELLSAGLPIDRAFDTMINASEVSARGVFLSQVRDSIREGARLSAAMAAAGGAVGRFEQAMIEAAEKSAAMELMLGRLADFLEEREQLREQIHTAMIYPVLILTVGICAAILMLGILIPRTIDALGSDVSSLPALTRAMMAFGSFVFKLGWVPLLLIAGGVVYLYFRIKNDDEFAERCDRSSFGVPLYGKGYRILVCQRFSKTMALLLEGGVSLIDAVVLSGRATGSRWIARLCEERAEEIRHGAKLSEEMKKVPYISDAIAEWMAVGEAAGGLARMTAKAGDSYTRIWKNYVTRSLGMLEPLILIFVGGFVLAVALSVLLPVIQLGQMVGN